MKQIIQALIKFRKELPSIEETDQAQYGSFAGLSKVLSVIKKPLLDNDLYLFHTTKIVDDKNILITHLVHSSGESLESEYLLPDNTKATNKNYAEGGSITYFRRYGLLSILGINAGIDDEPDYYKNNTSNDLPKAATHTYKQQKGLPTALDDQTKENYLSMLSSLYTSDKKEFDSLDEAMRNEFKFDGKLSDNIQEPKHVAFIEKWINAYNNK